MLILATMAFPRTGAAAEQALLLELILNGRPTGQIGQFTERDHVLYAMPRELADLGFAVPPALARNKQPIALTRLPGVRVKLNRRKLTVEVTAANAALAAELLGGGAGTKLAPLSRAGLGAVLNYDLIGTFTGQQNTGGGVFEMRGFSPWGVLDASALGSFAPTAGQQPAVRLDTTYTYSEPDALRRWRAGDVITGGLAWTRPVRLGGGQLTSDFGLRPDLITYPVPLIGSSAAVPSTVSVMVNGIRQFSQPVQPGPFQIPTLPYVNGAGDVTVTVQDALGHQSVISTPFYTATQLLKPGLASYSVEAGAVRLNYGTLSNDYRAQAAEGTLRYGLTTWLTPEAHIETTDSLALAGAGAAVKLATLGVLNVDIALSGGRGGISPGPRASSGAMGFIGFTRQAKMFSFAASATYATAGFRDLAAVNGAAMPYLILNASAGVGLGRFGTISLAYIGQHVSAASASAAAASPGAGVSGFAIAPVAASFSILTLSYTEQLTRRLGLYGTAFRDLRRNHSYGAAFGLTYYFGNNISASATASNNDGRSTYTFQASKPAIAYGDYGFQVADSEGTEKQRFAQAEYLSRWGRAIVGLNESPGYAAGQAELRGGLALLGGELFTGDQINDAFAVVKTGDVGRVPVQFENRPMGRTDANGVLMIPYLNSYSDNTVSIDAGNLPVDVAVGRTRRVVRPPDRSGIVVDFRLRRSNGALLKLLGRDGKPVPLGATATLAGGAAVPVGFDGAAYVTGLGPSNRVQVAYPSGTRCAVTFAYRPVNGDIPVIGPLRCQ